MKGMYAWLVFSDSCKEKEDPPMVQKLQGHDIPDAIFRSKESVIAL